ncbi:MAG: glutamine-hydrolyzing carbamoyl-phosphate synthase small subunit [Nitrosopumilaceae archaeon]|nr:glutamine-hydrolyzing carbamoyl-phosphate synthase small subunit [Nitrosopumilaceae archaeon]NIU00571.1 glutamine-hydrolyzing carbamoyl-phosphate synthase small subunit [Nitrosopumilaceae archaeon]NIU86957.1 glutamine-hydrolyzing carbamoyl-phosphate synthase small subunit [Nitrosopumilaceae archaeon]NIV66421.1 glutamine-hydrolyzing carbamoyl-phosphate synthase small subunit [Nitrosopumilaceae archaeon]NIX61173.1 glutamine-hydrolyzing carbamoyl-phosphate synthase small subunit [Nitrosopumilac
MSRVTISTKKSQYLHKFGKLILDDGTVFEGAGFGYSTTVFGEIVFNTGMVGYTETLTDPSYAGQILTLTYPLVGNYGVPDPGLKDEDGISKYFESDKIQVRGLAIHELSDTASHWNLSLTLDEWLYSQKVPGISGIDTRFLTTKLREKGVMMAALAVSDEEIDNDDLKKQLKSATPYTKESFMNEVSTKKEETYGQTGDTIVVVDTGAKNAILRNLLELGYKVIKVPWNTSIEKILSYNPKGVVLSNGPGDPEYCKETIVTAKELIEKNVPTLGICLGAQILGLAGDAQTYKLKYGHRGQNKSCFNLLDNQVYVTSQNHGYCIEPESLKDSQFDLWFTNTDDKTVEGIKHKKQNCIAVQFHPEASPGPYDCKFVFEELKKLMEEGRSAKK